METTVKRHNPLTFYFRVFMYMFIALMIRLFCLAPLAALFVFESGNRLRWLAVLCPVLLFFVVMPLRYSFAEALVQKKGSRYFSFDKALSFSSYGTKLCEGMLHIINVLKWAIPFVPVVLYAKKCFKELWVTEILSGITNIGAKAKDIVYAVINFFVKLFGKEPLTYTVGGLTEGFYVLLGVVGLVLLIFLIGVMRNSATRYIWAVAERDNRPVRTEVRRRIRGRRFTQLLVALCNLILLAPFLMIAYLCAKPMITEVSNSLLSLLTGSKVTLTVDLKSILTFIGAFFTIYMTLLPARRILTAFFASRQLRHVAPRADQDDSEELQLPVTESYDRAENMAYATEQPVVMPMQPMMQQPLPIEGMVPVQQMVNGQPQIVYMPADANTMPPAVVPAWAQAENDGTAIPETPVIPASFLGNEQNSSDLNA